MINIFIYARQSVAQERGASIESQIKLCKGYFINLYGIGECAFKVYQDEGYSGGNTNRPAFQKMMEEITKEKYKGAVLASYKIDRIARNIVDFVNVYSRLENNKIRFISVTEGFDASNDMGRLIMMILASFAEMERKNISRRIKDNFDTMHKKALWTGKLPPFGTKKVDIEANGKKACYLEIDEEYIPIIKDIYSIYLERGNIALISKVIYQKYKLKLNYGSLKSFLRNPFYLKLNPEAYSFLAEELNIKISGEYREGAGLISYNREQRYLNKPANKDKEMYLIIGRHNGIIDAEDWLRVQRFLDMTINTTPYQGRGSRVHWLSGIVKCSCCGGRGIVKRENGKKDVFACSGRASMGREYCNNKQIAIKDVEQHVLNLMDNYCTDKALFMELFPEEEEESFAKASLKKIRDKILENNKSINNLVATLAILSDEAQHPIILKLEEITTENKRLSEEAQELERELINDVSGDKDKTYEQLKNLRSFLNSGVDINTAHYLAKGVFKQIGWDRNKGEITIEFW